MLIFITDVKDAPPRDNLALHSTLSLSRAIKTYASGASEKSRRMRGTKRGISRATEKLSAFFVRARVIIISGAGEFARETK